MKSKFRQPSDRPRRFFRGLLLLLLVGLVGAVVYVAVMPPEPVRERVRIDIPDDRFAE